MAAPTRRWSPAVAWTALVLLASVVDPSWVLAGGGSDAAGLGVETWFHLGGYAVLAGLVAAALDAAGWRTAILAVAVASAVGAGVEVVQAPLPFRTASVADAVTNVVGATVGVAARTAWQSAVEEPR